MDNLDIFVISGGKCGSTTLKETFLYNNYSCIKAHNPDCFKKQFGYDGFYDTITKSSKEKELIIIDSYRTPIERQISSFFENGEKHISNFLNRTVYDQIKIFNKSYLYKIETYHIINNIYDYYNIHNDTSYDFDRKYLIHKHNNLTFIKLHYNDIKEWDKILTHIFEKPIILKTENVSNIKPYYHKYKQFLENYKIPKNILLEKIAKDEEFKKFQTPEQQEYYIKYWLKKSY